MSAVKKAIKKVGKFLKKHWKKIALAAAVVFTAGIATVGFKGFALAAKASGGGFLGTLKAIGGTLKAGVAAIGKTIGIGKGVTTSTAGGMFSSAPALAGTTAGSGVGLGGGAAAQALGLAPKPMAGLPAAAGPTVGPMGGPPPTPGTTLPPPTTATTGAAVGQAAVTAAPRVGFMNTLGGQALIQGGLGMVSQMIAGRQEDEEAPKGYFGVDLQGGKNLSPEQLKFNTADITGGVSSFRRPLMYDPQPAGG